jgi:hypothetical protein
MAAAGAVAVEPALFDLVTELELQKAVRLQYGVSLLTLVPQPEEGSLAEPGRVGAQLGEMIKSLLRATDVIEKPATSAKVRVLLVAAVLEDLPAIISRLEAEVSHHRVLTDRGARHMTLRIGAACFPTTATTAEDLRNWADARASETDSKPNAEQSPTS